MAEFVRVDARSLAEVEAFLSNATRSKVVFGRVWLVTGVVGAIVARVASASAITFGPVICLDGRIGRSVRENPDRKHIELLDGLLVHELVHTWQYRKYGTGRFLWLYLFFYFTNLYELGSIRREARTRAYQMIEFEAKAFALERDWSRRR